MDTKKFLEAALGHEGVYCVWANRLSDNHRIQKFYPDIDSVLSVAQDLDANGYDAYFALATFVEDTSRTADNVHSMRSFFLDLDCGPTKEYDTQAEALRALQGFCKQLSLPKPTIVNSGRGIHAYWFLEAPVSKAEWLPIAERLKSLCKSRGLHADPVVTADAARILRVPSTHNHKDEPPTDVLVIGTAGEVVAFDTFSKLVDIEGEGVLTAPRKYTPNNQDALTAALAGSYVSRFKTIMLKTVQGKGCAQLGEVVLNQANVSEPLWRAGLSIAKFCADGGKAIHKISEKHEGYSPEETEYKVSLIKGPYLCARFDEYRPEVCPNCQHWGRIKSPISLGREVEEAEEDDNIVVQKPLNIPAATPVTYVIPKYPTPYFRGKNGGVFKHGTNAEGEPKDTMVYFNDLYVVRRLRDGEHGESLVMRLHLPKDGVREFTVPLTAVGAKDEFRKHLAMQGVAVLNVAELMEYTMRWVNELQFKSEADEALRQFGWIDEKATAFAAGNTLIYGDRLEVNSPSTATLGLLPYFEPKGTLEGWKETMRFYDRPGMELHQFMVGISFGAPLMHFQAINAAAFHAYSPESGLGKTTGMLAGASIWGDPDWLMMQERDTFNSKMNRAEVYKNIVCYMDELTNTAPKDLSDWAYQLPSGLQRNRMGIKANTERFRGKPWKTLFATTGNTDMLDRIALYKALPKAEAQRVLSHRVQAVKFATKAETDKFANDVKKNFGHAGIVYIQYILNNKQACIELAEAVQLKIDKAAGLVAENRFWSVLVSRTIAGLMLAKKAGLIDWQIQPIVQWAIKVMQRAQNTVQDMDTDAEATLVDYLSEHYNSMLRIKSTEDARNKNIDLEKIIVPEAAPRGNAFIARYEYDVKRLYLLPKPFKQWCGKQQLNYAAVVDELKTGRTKATRAKVRLSKGTYMNFPPTDALVIDCSGFMDDETEEAMATNSALFQAQEEDN